MRRVEALKDLSIFDVPLLSLFSSPLFSSLLLSFHNKRSMMTVTNSKFKTCSRAGFADLAARHKIVIVTNSSQILFKLVPSFTSTMPSVKRNSNFVGSPEIRKSRRAKSQRVLMNLSGFTANEQKESYRFDQQRESTLANVDQLELTGREFWNASKALQRPFLEKFQHQLAESWAFYPLKHGTSKDVKTKGTKGLHYANDYRELGYMVEEYGLNIAAWPNLLDQPLQETEVISVVGDDEDEDEDDANSFSLGTIQSPATQRTNDLTRVMVTFGGKQRTVLDNIQPPVASGADNVIGRRVSVSPLSDTHTGISTQAEARSYNAHDQTNRKSFIVRVQELEMKLYGKENTCSDKPLSERMKHMEDFLLGKVNRDEEEDGLLEFRLGRLESGLA
jgi:hypothetical protein